MATPAALPKTRLSPNFIECILCLHHIQLHPDIIKIIINIIAHRSRDAISFRAKLAEQAERYGEMAAEMAGLLRLGVLFTVEERNLFSVAFKNVVGARRSSWRIVNSVAQKEEAKAQPYKEQIMMSYEYLHSVEGEIREICLYLLQLLEKLVFYHRCEFESVIFFHKMRGDYYRYLCELVTPWQPHSPVPVTPEPGTEQAEFSQQCLEAYTIASQLASEHLLPTHPIRLGLALNFSVYYQEIMNQHQLSSEVKKKAFDDAITGLEDLSEDSYKDSTLIMQLLRDFAPTVVAGPVVAGPVPPDDPTDEGS